MTNETDLTNKDLLQATRKILKTAKETIDRNIIDKPQDTRWIDLRSKVIVLQHDMMTKKIREMNKTRCMVLLSCALNVSLHSENREFPETSGSIIQMTTWINR